MRESVARMVREQPIADSVKTQIKPARICIGGLPYIASGEVGRKTNINVAAPGVSSPFGTAERKSVVAFQH